MEETVQGCREVLLWTIQDNKWKAHSQQCLCHMYAKNENSEKNEKGAVFEDWID